jgi:membrane-bound lytic murein transglycosylase A
VNRGRRSNVAPVAGLAGALLVALGLSRDRPDLLAPALRSAARTPGNALAPVSPPQGLADELDPQSLLAALDESIAVLEATPQRRLAFGPDLGTAAQVAAQLREVQALVRSGLGGRELLSEIAARWRWYRSTAGPGRVLVTGYYEASLRGSRRRDGPFQTPLYRPPAGIIHADLGLFAEELLGRRIVGWLEAGRLVPLPSRHEIASGALGGKGLELLWVDDPVEAFFLEVQGSGRVALEDGSVLRIGYAAQNGHPYRAIGRLLREEGKIPADRMSAQSIKAYLRASPEDQARVFAYNPGVVFFQVKTRGPEGSSGAVVTPGRSIAADAALFPVGALALLETTRPVLDALGQVTGHEPMVRLVLNQDTGGAIRGPGRVDLFCGFGPEAEALAGHLQHRGTLYFIGPHPPASP